MMRILRILRILRLLKGAKELRDLLGAASDADFAQIDAKALKGGVKAAQVKQEKELKDPGEFEKKVKRHV